jgi:non-heme chloroperoxidase
MRYVESFDGTRIAYRRTGSGPQMLLLPGINFSSDVWDPTVAALAPDFELVTMDLRGHGDSDKPAGSYAYDVHVRDVHALVGALELDELTVVGWSLGGAIALRYASEAPAALRGLFLSGPAAPRFTAASDYPHGLPEEAVRSLMERELADRPAYRRWVIEQSFHQAPPAETIEWLWGISMKTPSWASHACLEALVTEDLRSALPAVAVPARVVRGAHDGFVSAEGAAAVAAAIPECDLVEFANSGHAAFLEEPERFHALLRDFAAREPVSSASAQNQSPERT